MFDTQAISAFAALAHEDRLRAFRALVKAGPKGMASGDIAQALQIAPTRMSFHLSGLERSGLVAAQREGRRIIYSVRFDRVRALLTFLTQDCCNGRPEICAGLADMTDALQREGC